MRKRVLTEAEIAYLRANYPAKTVVEIAADLHCGGNVISRTLRELGIATRQSGWQPKLAEGKRQAILKLWRQGKAAWAISQELHAGTGTVRSVVEAAGLDYERRIGVGERSPNWKGGRVQSGKYLAVYVERDDPMRAMANHDGYVMEHRLVMARALGRTLKRHETVHHVNGQHHDNRLENLQLRTGRHGKGVVMRCLDCGSHNVEAVMIRED
jgi:hypothetical protein